MNPDYSSMATEYELTFYDYLSIMRRRAPYMIGIFITGFLISVIVAIVIPPTYRATGTIMVESQQIAENVMSTTVKTQLEDQINSIKQRVMTRENLLQMANHYGLFKENTGNLNSTILIDKLRNRIIVEMGNPDDKRTNQQGKKILAFTVSFEDRHPDIALDVTKDLISLFLSWNIKLRTEGAEETTDFLTQESDKLKIELDRQEKLIADFKQQHKNALPEQLTLRMTMLSRAENDMREVERDIRSTKEEIRTQEVELAAAKHGLGDVNTSQNLPALKAELARLSAIYTPSHPDIKRLQYKISALESSAESGAATGGDESNPAVFRIQSKINSDKARLLSLAQQREMLQRKMAENENAMIQTPKVEQDLAVLIRDRDSAQKKFEELRNKRMNAKIAETLESESKSGRFSVLEPPLYPEKPFKPNRIKIILIGFLLSIIASGGGMMMLEMVDKRLRGAEVLTHVLGTRPLAVIPYLPVKEDEIQRIRMIKLSIKIAAAVLALIIVILILLNFIYMPIDEMFMKIIGRFR